MCGVVCVCWPTPLIARAWMRGAMRGCQAGCVCCQRLPGASMCLPKLRGGRGASISAHAKDAMGGEGFAWCVVCHG